jgi:hypothetical protein
VGGAIAGFFASGVIQAIVLFFIGRYHEGPTVTAILIAAVLGACFGFAYGHRSLSMRTSIFACLVLSGATIGFFAGYAVYPTIALSKREQPLPPLPSGKLRAPYEAKGICVGVTVGAIAGALVGTCIVPFVRIRCPSAV